MGLPKIRTIDGKQHTLQELADLTGVSKEELIRMIAERMHVPKRPPYTFGVCGHQSDGGDSER